MSPCIRTTSHFHLLNLYLIQFCFPTLAGAAPVGTVINHNLFFHMKYPKILSHKAFFCMFRHTSTGRRFPYGKQRTIHIPFLSTNAGAMVVNLSILFFKRFSHLPKANFLSSQILMFFHINSSFGQIYLYSRLLPIPKPLNNKSYCKN